MGRGKKHQVTDETRDRVRMLKCCGVTNAMVASVLGISEDTLERYYRDELAHGLADATSRIAGTLYQKALSGDTTAMIFWLKTRGGWRETVQNINLSMDMRKSVDEYSDEELLEIIGDREGRCEESVLVIHTGEPEERFKSLPGADLSVSELLGPLTEKE